jgi:hypothetical protein
MHERLIPWAVRLLRTGIVPGNAIEDLSVGYSQFRTKTYSGLDGFLTGKHQKPVFVQGEWGTGKSHMLNYFRMLATNLGLPTAFVSLNPRTLPLNYPQRLYGEIAASVRTDSVAGLRTLLESMLHDPNSRAKLKQYSITSSSVLSSHLLALINHYDEHSSLNPRLELSWSYILGEDLGWADYTYKREQALIRIEGLAECLRSVNGAGLLVLFDEMETIEQLWNARSRTVGYEVVVRVAKMRSVWALFAITDRFLKIVKKDSAQSGGDAEWLSNGLNSGGFLIFDPPNLDRSLAMQLATAVAELYLKAYPLANFSGTYIQEWVEEWGRNPSRNPRRLIRLVVNRLDLMRPLGPH